MVKVNRLPNRVAPNTLQQTCVRYTVLNIHENGISQEKLAEKLNVSRSAVAKWETDGRLS